jgi:cytochrome P450
MLARIPDGSGFWMSGTINIAELDPAKVLRIDLGSQETKARMLDYCAEWGRREPFYVPRDGHVIVICGRHADALEVYQDRERFSNAVPKEKGFEMFAKFMDVRVLAQMDGAPHDRIRRLMSPAMAPKAVNRLERQIVEAVDELLDKVEAGGPSFDGMKDFGDHLIVEALLTKMLGLTPAQKAVFLEMHRVIPLITYTEAGNSYPEECLRAFADARALIDEIVAERHERPGDDLISDLIAVRDEGDKLSDHEMFDQIFTVTAGALSGTTLSIGGILYALYKHPDVIKVLRGDPGLISSAVAECQRWYVGGYMTFPRFATCDTEVGGTQIKKGMVMRVCPQAAHYDPSVYPDPLRFDIHRNPRNIAFGSGPHLCLGHHFAKLLLRIAVERLIQRFPDARLVDPAMSLQLGGSVGELRILSLPMTTS